MRLETHHCFFERHVDTPRTCFDYALISLMRNEKVNIGKRNASALRQPPHRIADHPHREAENLPAVHVNERHAD